MANLIQASVYQIDGAPLPQAITLDFQTSNLVIREATVAGFSAINSAILYYNVPNNQLSVQTFYVGEEIADLVAAANVGSTTQLQATVTEINEDPQIPGGVQYSFPANEILIGPGTESYIQFKNVRYSVLEKQSDLLVSGNGASAYKVYTALLTQSGGDDSQSQSSGPVQKGVTYFVDGATIGLTDFSNVGGQFQTPETGSYYFVATIDGTPNEYGGATADYNTGAPVVTVLENTIGNTWFTYSDVGIYKLNNPTLTDNNKLYFSITPNTGKSFGFTWNDEDGSGAFILTKIISGGSVVSNNSLLGWTPIEIRVYN